MSTDTTQQKHSGFLKRLRRLVGIGVARRSREEDDSQALALERQFLAGRRAQLERELARRVELLRYGYEDKRDAIERYVRNPLPDAWDGGGVPLAITSALRPPRREIEIIDALEGAIVQRPLVQVIEGTIQRVEEDLSESLRRARPSELYGETYWTDELMEQILSHLLHLYVEWLNHPTR